MALKHAFMSNDEILRESEAKLLELQKIVPAEQGRPPVIIVTEATSPEQSPDYAFRLLGGNGKTPYDLPEAFTQQILQWSHKLYDSHGLADFIIETAVTLIMGGGLQYQLSFEKGFPVQYEKLIRNRVKEWWYHEDVNFEDRAGIFVLELLLEGEHGWRFEVNETNGFVRIGDFSRRDVVDIIVDKFDPLTLRQIVVKEASAEVDTGKNVTIDVLQKNPVTRRLGGSCLYSRYRIRASRRRGRPFLQTVIDELRSEKQFRVLGLDRSLARLSLFMDTLLKGMSDEQMKEFISKNPAVLPTKGNRLYHNESVENDLLSANIEAGELVALMQFLVTIIAASVGMPPHWLGIGEGANRSIADAQQDPAMRNRKREKDQIFRVFEKTVDFVIDSAIAAGYVAAELPGDKKITVIDSDGQQVERPLRDCVTVTVSPLPIENNDRDALPLAATTAALDLLSLVAEYTKANNLNPYSREQIAAILNFGHKRDGLDIEVSPEMQAVQQPAQPNPLPGRGTPQPAPAGGTPPQPGQTPTPTA